MADITATCPEHGEVPVPISILEGEEGYATLVGNHMECPHCRQVIPVPDGKYRKTAFGVVRKELDAEDY